MAHGVHQRRQSNFFPQPSDKNLDELGVVFMFPLPNPFAQFDSGKDATGLAHENFEQRQLARRKIEVTAATMHFLADEIQGQVADAKRDLWFFRVTPPQCPHAGQQFLHGKRFGEIIIGAELQARHAIVQFAARGQDQDTMRHMFGAQSPQHFETIDARQTNIEHKEIEGFFLNFTQGGFTIMNDDGFMACLPERGSDVPGESDFIFNYQDVHLVSWEAVTGA